jgi:hypothetical protein
MAAMTREDVTHIVGPAMDDSVILEILGTGASKEELEEASAWLSADDAMTRSAHHRPHGVVASFVRFSRDRKSILIASKVPRRCGFGSVKSMSDREVKASSLLRVTRL